MSNKQILINWFWQELDHECVYYEVAADYSWW